MLNNINKETEEVLRNAYEEQIENKSKSKNNITIIKLDDCLNNELDDIEKSNKKVLSIITGIAVTIVIGGVITYKILNK